MESWVHIRRVSSQSSFQVRAIKEQKNNKPLDLECMHCKHVCKRTTDNFIANYEGLTRYQCQDKCYVEEQCVAAVYFVFRIAIQTCA